MKLTECPKLRSMIFNGCVDGGATRSQAQETVDLTMHAVQSSINAITEVGMRASEKRITLGVVLFATALLADHFTGKTKELPEDLGLGQTGP